MGRVPPLLPFDRAATIMKVDEKVFTRIKDEESRAVIRRFLAQRTRSAPLHSAAK